MEILGKKYTYEITTVGGLGGVDFGNTKKLKITLRPKGHGKSSHSRVRLEKYEIDCEENGPAFEKAFATVIKRAIEKRFPTLEEDKKSLQEKYDRVMKKGNFTRARLLVDAFREKYSIIPNIQESVERYYKKINRSVTETLVVEATELFDQGNHEEAIKQLESIMSSKPHNQKKYQEILDDLNTRYEKIKEINLRNQEYSEQISKVNDHIKDNDLNAAIDILKEMVKQHPEHQHDLQQLENLKSSIAVQTATFAFVQQQIELGHVASAIEDMRMLVSINPDYQPDLERLIKFHQVIQEGELRASFNFYLENNHLSEALEISQQLSSLDEKYRPLFRFIEQTVSADAILKAFNEKLNAITESYKNGDITEDEYLLQTEKFSDYELQYKDIKDKIEKNEFCPEPMKDALSDNSDYIAERQDIALSNIILNKLTLIDKMFGATSTSDACLDDAEILSLFETIDLRWKAIKQKNDHTDLMFFKAHLASKMAKYDIAINTYQEILSVDPNNYDAFICALDFQVRAGREANTVIEFIKQYQSYFEGECEKTIIAIYEAKLTSNSGEIVLLMNKVKTFEKSRDKAYCLNLCLCFLDDVEKERLEVAKYIGHSDARTLLYTEDWIVLLKLQMEQCHDLKNQIADETDSEKSENLKEQLSTLEEKTQNTFNDIKTRIEKEQESYNLETAYKASYVHLGVDLTMMLFEKLDIHKYLGISDKLLAEAHHVVNLSFAYYPEFYKKFRDGYVQLRERMGELSKEDEEILKSLNPILALPEVSGTTHDFSVSALSETISKISKEHNGRILLAKLVIALSDLRLHYLYDKYLKDCKSKKEETPHSYEDWYENRVLELASQGKKLSVMYAESWVLSAFNLTKKAFDGLTRVQSINQLYYLYSNINQLASFELMHEGARAFISFPYLEKHLVDLSLFFNDGRGSTNWYTVFLISWLRNMSDSATQQFLMTHDETVIRGMSAVLDRNQFINLSSKIFQKLPAIRITILLVRVVLAFNKSLVKINQDILDTRVKHLNYDIKQLVRELVEASERNSTLKPSRRASSLFCEYKYTALDLCVGHSERNKLYITAMYYQRYFGDSLENLYYHKDGNGFFKAVSCYTDESATQLREMAVNYIKDHTDFFKDFLINEFSDYIESLEQLGGYADELVLRGLSIVLKRAIIVIFNDCYDNIFACLERQGLAFSNNIPNGNPIFVLYDEMNEQYHGLRIRGEDYFEFDLERKKRMQKELALQDESYEEQVDSVLSPLDESDKKRHQAYMQAMERVQIDKLRYSFFSRKQTGRKKHAQTIRGTKQSSSQEFDFENNRIKKRLGLNCKNVRGDGWCFFRAVVKQIIDRDLNAHRDVSCQLPTTFENFLERVREYFDSHAERIMEKVFPSPKREYFGTSEQSNSLYLEAVNEYQETKQQKLEEFKKNFNNYVNRGLYETPRDSINSADWMPQIISDIFQIDIDVYDAHRPGAGMRTENGYEQRIGVGRINNNHYISLDGDLNSAYLAEEVERTKPKRKQQSNLPFFKQNSMSSQIAGLLSETASRVPESRIANVIAAVNSTH